MGSTEGGVSSVERALRLLEILSKGPVGATDLARALGTGKATAFRLAKTLQASNYVVQLEDTRYRLGPRCLVLAAAAVDEMDLLGELRWAEAELFERTGETVLLAVRSGLDAVCIDSIPSKHAVVSVTSVGEIWPLHACSAGLAFLADDDALLEAYLRTPMSQHTSATIVDPELLRKRVQETQHTGYALNREYFRDGVCAVGSVVRDARGQARAALAVMLPEFRLEDVGEESLGRLTADVANRASERLGWHPYGVNLDSKRMALDKLSQIPDKSLTTGVVRLGG